MSIGRRIHVMGNTGAGKSTLAERLAVALGVPFVELDALNWMPNWRSLADSEPERLERRILEATQGDAWVVAGSYIRFSERLFWERLDTVVYIDLSVPRLLWRLARRSWRRSRSKELLWGTNYERFIPQFKVWDKHTSLFAWAIAEQARKRRDLSERMSAPRWRHIRFIRLVGPREVEAFARSIERQASARGRG